MLALSDALEMLRHPSVVRLPATQCMRSSEASLDGFDVNWRRLGVFAQNCIVPAWPFLKL